MLLFKVAARIGKTVSELERELDYTELLEWSEFFNHELGTYEKSDYYLAQVACVIAQANSAKGKKFKINDFLIKFRAGAEKVIKLSGEQMKSIFEGLTK